MNICEWKQLGDSVDYDDAVRFFCVIHEAGPYFYSHPSSCGITEVIKDGWEGQCNSVFENKRCTQEHIDSYHHERRRPSGEILLTWTNEYGEFLTETISPTETSSSGEEQQSYKLQADGSSPSWSTKVIDRIIEFIKI